LNGNSTTSPRISASFADAAAGDLHLEEPIKGVVDAGERLALVSHDIDHQPRLDRPDIGADEFSGTALAQANPSAKPQPAGETSTTSPKEKSADGDNGEPAWVEPMRQVHAGFEGTPGYVAQLGDSITFSMAFWTPIDWDEPQQYLAEDDGLPKTPPGKRWRDVIQGERDKGPDHGNYSGWTVKNVLAAVEGVLERERPEVAILMVGTNDISGGQVPDSYRADLEKVVAKCIEAHCVPILNTIPPRRGHEAAVLKVNGIIREVAKERHVPLVDYHAEILRRRLEGAWQGTLIADDGVHPTAGKTNVYTEENLKSSGYALRNWLNFLAVREVHFGVLHPASGKPSRH
jgi:lysophospholipase L1-like esterase